MLFPFEQEAPISHQVRDIKSGYQIGYQFLGSEQETPTIVLLNGSAFNYLQWDYFLKHGLKPSLQAEYRFLRYDYGGTGRSPLTNAVGDWDIFRIADELNELLDALSLSCVHLYGLSKGSLVGHIVAARHPERVASVAGYGWFYLGYSNVEQVCRRIERRLGSFESLKDIWTEPLTWKHFKRFWHSFYRPILCHGWKIGRVHEYFIMRQVYKLIAPTPIKRVHDWFAYAVEAMGALRHEIEPVLAGASGVPFLLQHAQDDETLPVGMAQELSSLMPSAVYQEYGEGYSHLSPVMQRDHALEVATCYRDFWVLLLSIAVFDSVLVAGVQHNVPETIKE